MGKGKKKGKKDDGKEAEVPSVAGLSISEEAPSTSQAAEDEGLGLGMSSHKNKRKQKQAAKQGSQPEPAATMEEPKPEPKPVPKPEPKEEPQEESVGLGLGGGGGKRRPRKKQSLAAAEAKGKEPEVSTEAPWQGLPKATEEVDPPRPVPAPVGTGRGVAPGAGRGLGRGRGAAPETGSDVQSAGRGAAPMGRGVWRAQSAQVGPMAAPGGPMGTQGGPMSAPGGPMAAQGRPMVAPGGPMAAAGGPIDQPGMAGVPAQGRPVAAPNWRDHPPSRSGPTSASQSTSRESTSTSVARVTPRAALCRYEIPAKILGRMVRSIPTEVITNYLPMIFKPIKVFRYDVIVKPDKPKKMIPTAFKEAIKKNYPGNPYIAFDQVKNCYTMEPLKDVTANERNSILVDLPDPNGRVIRFEVSLKSTGVVDLANLKRHMETGGSSLNAPNEEIQCIDVVLRQGALEAYVKCGRQFFKRPNSPIDLSGGLEMWTGLFQSAIFTTRAFINIDVAHKGFPVHQSLIDALTKSFRLGTDRKIEEQRSREIDNFMAFLKGLRVVATLVGPPNNGQKREFIANGLVDSPARLSFTSEKDGRRVTMTVAEYFAKEKGYRIRYPHLNCVWVGPKDKNIYYPMELLQVAYGQARNRQLNEFQLSTMVREAAAPPYERKRKIEEVTDSMMYSNNPFFKKFGLEISRDFLKVNAKILAPPVLDCGERTSIQPRRGVWQAKRLNKPEALSSWGFIAVDCPPNNANFEAIRDLLMDVGRQMGMQVSDARMVHFNVPLADLRNKLFAALEKEVRFLFIIVGQRGRDTYHRVKQLAERDVGILTQCIKENTASRRINPQTIRNILLKVNSKLMGINQVLDARAIPNCLKGGDVMIVGADVTHPSPDQTSIPSIAAVTASMDAKAFSYSIELSIQTPKKETIVEFEEMMVDHLKRWRTKHGVLPKKIYVFRDGVSEGQFAEVMNCELSAVHRAYNIFGAPKPEVLFLLVQKRHHTRFFTSPRCENVEPGTVVDTDIVHPKELDFYLVSHQAIKGTARPTRYHAVCNDSKIPHDEVEQLTYYLCHLYSRCMRSVSYPTPTYYAHLACFRARSLTYGQTFDNAALETKPQRLKVLDKMLQFSRMFFV